MDSSFGKNAANRVEESYGDAKNLRLRYPQAALGFLYALRSTVLVQEPAKAEWLIDLLRKLGREDDAYHAVALVVPQWGGEAPAEDEDDGGDDPLVAAGLGAPDAGPDEPEDMPADELRRMLSGLPEVTLRHDAVPPGLDPGAFFARLIDHILDTTPVTFHRAARARRAEARGEPAQPPLG